MAGDLPGAEPEPKASLLKAPEGTPTPAGWVSSLGWGLVHLNPGPFQGFAQSLGGLAWLRLNWKGLKEILEVCQPGERGQQLGLEGARAGPAPSAAFRAHALDAECPPLRRKCWQDNRAAVERDGPGHWA